MYILFSILLAFAAQTTILHPYNEQTLPIGNITYTYYNPIVIPMENSTINITIIRYVYPIISGELNVSLGNRTLEEVKCYTKLRDVPDDFAQLFQKKLESESIDRNFAQAYIYDILLWAHPYNNKTGCIPDLYLYDFNYSILTYVDNYVVSIDSGNINKDIYITIPELSLNLTNKPYHQLHRITFNSTVYPKSKSLTLSIKIQQEIPVLKTIFTLLKDHYDRIYRSLKKPYLSFGLLVGAILAIIIAINGLITFLSILIPGIINKQHNIFQKALGYHDTEALKRLIMGILFIGVGIYLEDNFSKKVYLQKLDYNSLLELASLDIFFGITMVLYVLGVIWITDFIKDYIKGLIGGKSYYTAYSGLISKSTLKRLLNDLKQKVAQFREEIGKGIVEGIDVSDYLEEINAIPLHALEEEINKSENLYNPYTRLKSYLQRIDELINKYRHTYADVLQNYPFWREQVRTEIKKYGSISIDALTMVPTSWRYWFAKKFVSDFPEFVIEDNVIKKLNLPKKELLRMKLKQFFDDHPESAILIEDGTFFYDGPKKTLMKAALVKLLLTEKDIEAESDLYLLKTYTKYNIRLIIFGRKEDLEKLKGGFYGL